MQVKVLRQSGEPVKLEYIEAIRQKHNEVYDRYMAKHKYDPVSMNEADNIKAAKFFNRITPIIEKQYPAHDEWELPTTPTMWGERVRRYGPIGVAVNAESGELTLIILDAFQAQD